MRITEIMEDLQKRTDEEMRNWVLGSSIQSQPLNICCQTLCPDARTSGRIVSKVLHHDSIVSSPVSFVSAATFSEPRQISGFKQCFTRQEHSKRSRMNTQPQPHNAFTKRETYALVASQYSLPSLYKPSFQSFLKRVAKRPFLGAPPNQNLAAKSSQRQLLASQLG